jgi:uncharacterized protein YaaR (DUF327 family)
VKVGEASNQFPDFPQQKKVRENAKAPRSNILGTPAKADAEFSEAFLNVADLSLQASLDQLMAGVQEQGERLAKRTNFEELNKYKELVRSFLLKISRDLYKVKLGETAQAGPGQKVYVIIQKVDLELEKLSKLVLAGQAPQLRILERLDQIRGLLLDAYK